MLDRFLAISGPDLTHISFGVEADRPLEEGELVTLGNRIRAEKPTRALTLRLHGGANPLDAHPVFFSCLLPANWAPEPASFVSAGFSMKLLMGGKTTLVGWTQSACEAFSPDHGSGGFSLISNVNWAYGSEVMGQIAAVLERFVALDHPAVPTGSFVTRAGPLAANWLTILNAELIGTMGGTVTVDKAMADLGGQALPWSNGLLLVAPGAPQIGDTENAALPAAYHKVGAMIAALRGAPDAAYFPDAGDRDMLTFAKVWRGRLDKADTP